MSSTWYIPLPAHMCVAGANFFLVSHRHVRTMMSSQREWRKICLQVVWHFEPEIACIFDWNTWVPSLRTGHVQL